ncbi:MAG: amidohydrolase [Clostridia bacterium]|nr:amidohydrolase [Clostridia bacterium]
MKEKILEEAQKMSEYLVEKRRYLHRNAETGFDLENTVNYVEAALVDMGYQPKRCGKAGLIALAGGKKEGKVFLIRGDMDALPIKEESGLDFASTNGRMHACGHDMHVAMMLGAAKLLKEHEEEINGTVKLMFQPAEEIFEGSNDMIKSGLLEEPKVDAALMIHVMTNNSFKPGTVIVSSPGVSAPAADYFEIKIQGSGCHGSMPNKGVDPINVAANIFLALQEINAREISVTEKAVLTIGTFHAGSTANVIPDTAVMGGTLRTYNEGTRTFIKKRMQEVSEGIAKSFRANAEVVFGSRCPTLVNDKELSYSTSEYVKDLLGEEMAFTVEELNRMSGNEESAKSAGSEDFAYVSHEVPSIMLALAAGKTADGYCYAQHHPKVRFDEEALPFGSAVYAYVALEWLKKHNLENGEKISKKC